MDELLQKLLEAEVLSAETKKELEDVFKTKLEEAVKQAKEVATAEVQVELREQFIAEREALIEAVDTKVGELLAEEIAELKIDIERFRDLEAEYAEKLVEAKGEMANDLKKDLGNLVEQLDTFLEIRLSSELEELREDVVEVRKNEFGRKIFEAFASEFGDNYATVNEESATAKLADAEKRAEEAEAALEESESARTQIERAVKMEKILKPLDGHHREVMETILKNVSTDKLEEGYKTFIGRVIRESATEVVSEKEEEVLAEGSEKSSGKKTDKKSKVDKDKEDLKKKVSEAVVSTGDEEIVEEAVSEETKRHLAHMRRLAGINY